MNESLCTFCSEPAKCPLCDVMRNPRPLTMRSIGAMHARVQVLRSGSCAPVDAAEAARKAELVKQIEATKAEIARLQSRRTVAPAHVPAPAVTAPMDPPVKLAPAPSPQDPFEGVEVRGELREGDWLGLSARVFKGLMSTEEAERIGMDWNHQSQRAVC